MSRKEAFIKQINDGYLSKGQSIILGGVILEGEALTDAHIKVPLKNPESPRINCRSNRNRKN